MSFFFIWIVWHGIRKLCHCIRFLMVHGKWISNVPTNTILLLAASSGIHVGGSSRTYRAHYPTASLFKVKSVQASAKHHETFSILFRRTNFSICPSFLCFRTLLLDGLYETAMRQCAASSVYCTQSLHSHEYTNEIDGKRATCRTVCRPLKWYAYTSQHTHAHKYTKFMCIRRAYGKISWARTKMWESKLENIHQYMGDGADGEKLYIRAHAIL